MSAYGVQENGYVIKTQVEIYASLVARAQAAPNLGPDLDYSSASPLGQLLGLIAAELAEVYEVDEATYSSGDPEAAIGVALDNICSITGTTRPAADYSRSLSQTVNLDAGATLNQADAFISPAGRPDVLFQMDQASVANSSGIAADVPCTFTCTTVGAINVAAGSLSVIASPQTGWNSTTNAQDVIAGRSVGLDPETRALRTVELYTRGSSSTGAIRAHIAQVPGVESAVVLENTTDTVDANGLLPHSFVGLLDDGAVPAADDDAVAQAVYDTRAAGIGSQGSSSGTATDSEDGSTHTEQFQRATRKPIYISLTLTTSASFPVDGRDQVKAAIKAAGDNLTEGEDVVALFMRSKAFNVAGVVDVPAFTLGFSPSPVGTSNLSIGVYERATFDTSLIVVTA